MRIAVDAMGGDAAPREIVKGAHQAAVRHAEDEVLLFGDERQLRPIMRDLTPAAENLHVRHCAQVIGMSESPVEALRRKKDASVLRCVESVGRDEADALVTAGNTGAAVVAATIKIGLLEGIKRPGIAVPLPNQRNGCCWLIDAGANINCKPLHLLQYGVMASIFCRHAQEVETPRVGLLNIGEETSKGNDLVRYTFNLFEKLPIINFIGNVEGQDIFSGDCNVVVCEGFTGNAILKCAEGISEVLRGILKEATEVPSEESATAGRLLERLADRTDYARFGGAPLLGVKGVCIICHGRSRGNALAAALDVAIGVAAKKVNDQILEEIRKHQLDKAYYWWPRQFSP